LINFEKVGPKEWDINNNNQNDKKAIKIYLSPSSVTNKFHIVTNFIEKLSEFHGEEFDKWIFNFIENCTDENKRASTITKSIDIIKKYVDEYLDSLNFDYEQFVDRSKAKKNSILFVGDEIEKIIRMSCYLKVYSIISNSENISLGKKQHRVVYNKFASDVINTDIVSKIFDVVKTKTFRYNLTDKFMWEYIKTIQCKDINVHIIEIFNFIMNNIIILCEEDKNPITYFVGVVDESVKWFLRSVYKGSIVYDDEISTEDIHGININNLITYSYNDTLGRLKAIAFEKIYDKLEKENSIKMERDDTDQYIINFQNRLSTIEYISPLCGCLVFPILSKMTRITYVHFKTISGEHAAILSYYLNTLLQKVFKDEYKNLFTLLDYYPLSSPSVNTTYKVKAIHEYINIQNKYKNFFGFNTKTLPHKILCHFIGRVSRINFTHLINGQKLPGIPLGKVESDMIKFYSLYFAGELTDKIDNLTNLMNKDF
jgi:hypothetical protein